MATDTDATVATQSEGDEMALSTKETNSSKTYLLSGTSSTMSKLIDIKEFPDLGKAPDTIEVTTLSDSNKRYILDIKDYGSLEFTANYTPANMKALSDAKTNTKFAVAFGSETGSEGKWAFDGEMSYWVKGAGTGAVREIGISIAVSSDVTETLPTA